ncbi:MAG: hypothetical protein A2677_02845 [Candidatus Komeilibacteria bacterium RIFCSPHIGHO2_01_FULL_52_14]|uniref:Uncharacterized protein n=1 Tax=Candidatus Komeilibacteria bacterium RIFCSPHIGHO2_01_FULL_52_14 TaxID=1798549 RepID=A0A1G2BMK1_9BACT|nr:MAG: hypothetical protein A2677_02845 [Candidatus Komeilibacteria bacterium RIFCSPHIGHO2_01_FULL_52_14]
MKMTTLSKGGTIAAIIYLVYACILIVFGFIRSGWETFAYFLWAGFPASIILIPLGAVLIFFIIPATVISVLVSMRVYYFLGTKIEQYAVRYHLGSSARVIVNKINPIGKHTSATFTVKMLFIGLFFAIMTIIAINAL